MKSFTQDEIFEILRSIRLETEEEVEERMMESDCALLYTVATRFGLNGEQAMNVTGEDERPGLNNLSYELNRLVQSHGLKVVALTKDERDVIRKKHRESFESVQHLEIEGIRSEVLK